MIGQFYRNRRTGMIVEIVATEKVYGLEFIVVETVGGTELNYPLSSFSRSFTRI